MLKSRKTTAAGLLTGLALFFKALADLFQEGGPGLEGLPNATPELAGAVGAILLGLWARDDNVTSEGTRASKQPPPAPPAEDDDQVEDPADLL